MRRILPLLFAVAVAPGCAGNTASVPLEGDPEDLSRLAGEWRGEYAGRNSGRSGSIVFRLAAGRDSAVGDVVMIPPGALEPLAPAPRTELRGAAEDQPKVLTIRFVRVGDGRVSGELAPYRAPRCDCVLHTTFTGVIRGDVVEGRYQTRGETIAPQDGTWRVTRRK